MVWYLILGYLAACYLWGMYIVARLYMGRRLRTLVTGGGGAAATPRLRLTEAPLPRPQVAAPRTRSEAA